MVARIRIGSTIEGAIRYNENKVEKGDAVILEAGNFIKDAEDLSLWEKTEFFHQVNTCNQRAKKNCVHISLSFAQEDYLSPGKLKDIAADYLQGIGFGEQPYLLYQHFDANHCHVHIVTTPIQWPDGKRISLHNIGKERSEPTRKEIELRYNLVVAESRGKSGNGSSRLPPADPAKVLYGKTETKAAVSNTVRAVFETYKFNSFEQYQAALKSLNILADRGSMGGRMYERKGMVYSVLDKNGQRIGVPIRASEIYTKPILNNVERKYGQDKNWRHIQESMTCYCCMNMLPVWRDCYIRR